MQQIADWLEKLNLGQYAQRFAENDVDVSVLRHLTDADLEGSVFAWTSAQNTGSYRRASRCIFVKT